MKTFLLLLLLLTSLLANKKDYSIIVHQPFDAALFDITQNYDRTLSAVGFSKEYVDTATQSNTYTNAFEYLKSSSGNFGSQMHILSVDDKAHILFSKQTKLSRFNKAIAVVKTPSNGFFIGGYTLDGSLIIMKLDAKANVLYTKIFGTKNYDRMSNLILLGDGGVLAIGSSTTSRSTHDNMFNTGLGNTDIFLTRFTKHGKLLWSKKYGTMYDDNGIDAVEAVDGSIVVISTTSYDKNRNVTLMRITENGNRIWLKHFKKNKKNGNIVIPKKIIRLKDNNFVVALTQYNEMQKEHIRFIKFDLYKNILIDKEIFTTYPSEINDIKEYSDSRFIAVGYVKDSYNTDGLAMILDANLVLLNQEHYGSENYDLFSAVTIMHNSQAAIAGVYTDDNSQETHMWITKLNPDASMTQFNPNASSAQFNPNTSSAQFNPNASSAQFNPNASSAQFNPNASSAQFSPNASSVDHLTDATNFYKRLCLLLKKEIELKQIVIKKDLSILLTDKSLYFNINESKLTAKQKNLLKILNHKLIPFLYANRDMIQSLEINGHTSSEWDSVEYSQRYLNNEKLSLQRSFETLSYLFINATNKEQKWLAKVSRGSGYSYSKRVYKNGKEDKKSSRRVSFKIVLKDK